MCEGTSCTSWPHSGRSPCTGAKANDGRERSPNSSRTGLELAALHGMYVELMSGGRLATLLRAAPTQPASTCSTFSSRKETSALEPWPRRGPPPLWAVLAVPLLLNQFAYGVCQHDDIRVGFLYLTWTAVQCPSLLLLMC